MDNFNIILMDTCALRHDGVRKSLRKEVLFASESAQILVLDSVWRELLSQQRAPKDARTRQEVDAAIRFITEEFPDRFLLHPHHKWDNVAAKKADAALACFAHCAAAAHVPFLLYSQDNQLAYDVVSLHETATVRMVTAQSCRDYRTEIKPQVEQNLRHAAKQFDIYLTAATVGHKAFRFCMKSFGLASMLQEHSHHLYLLRTSYEMLNAEARAEADGMVKAGLLNIIEPVGTDGADEYTAMNAHFDFRCSRQRALLLCADTEQVAQYAAAPQRELLSFAAPRPVIAHLRQSAEIAYYSRKQALRTAVSTPALSVSYQAIPAFSAQQPAVSVAARQVTAPCPFTPKAQSGTYLKPQIEGAINKGDFSRLEALLNKGGNPGWALTACFRDRRRLCLLPELLSLLQRVGAWSDSVWFNELVSGPLKKAWDTCMENYRPLCELLEALLPALRRTPRRAGVEEASKQLRFWLEHCSDTRTRTLLTEVLEAA